MDFRPCGNALSTSERKSADVSVGGTICAHRTIETSYQQPKQPTAMFKILGKQTRLKRWEELLSGQPVVTVQLYRVICVRTISRRAHFLMTSPLSHESVTINPFNFRPWRMQQQRSPPQVGMRLMCSKISIGDMRCDSK
jgi:hypothetical protein